MRIAKLPWWLSIFVSTTLERSVLAADRSAITAATTRGTFRTGIRCIGSEPTTAGDDGPRNSIVGDDSGECHQLLCLRPLTAQSDLYLRTLRHRRFDGWEGDDNERQSKPTIDTSFCWESVKDSESQHDAAVAVAVTTFHLPSSSAFRLDTTQQHASGDGRSSLATQIDLLLATAKVRNHEIRLPRSIAELFQHDTHSGSAATTATTTNPGDHDADSQSKGLPNSARGEPLAAIDLTGRWKPSETLSADDLAEYGEFLKACCSDALSYWTRKLVVSSSIVSRQEFRVRQSHEGRIVEFVDVHPLASKEWNRTLVTSNSSKDGGSHRPHPNRLTGPRGDPVVIEAYWQNNGTVHTSFLRNEITEDDSSADKGWVQTRRYLRSGEEEDDLETNRVMVVETIYYPTPFRTDAESRNSCNTTEALEEPLGSTTANNNPAATRMVWNWEEVIE